MPLTTIENAYQALDNITMVRGSHTFKFGVDIRMLRQTFIRLLGGMRRQVQYDQFITGNAKTQTLRGTPLRRFCWGFPLRAP